MWKSDKYRKALLETGVSPDDTDALVKEAERVSALADRLECSKCHGLLEKKVDPRQWGPSDTEGVWHNYKCAACGDFFDRLEPMGGTVRAPAGSVPVLGSGLGFNCPFCGLTCVVDVVGGELAHVEPTCPTFNAKDVLGFLEAVNDEIARKNGNAIVGDGRGRTLKKN